VARTAALRCIGFAVWGCFGAVGGFLAVETVGWVLDPLAVLLLWRICSRSRARDQFLAMYAIGYLAVTAHYLVPDFYAAWPSLAYRIYFGVLLLAGVVLLATSTWHATSHHPHRPAPPSQART
jgi:hypothetical protein